MLLQCLPYPMFPAALIRIAAFSTMSKRRIPRGGKDRPGTTMPLQGFPEHGFQLHIRYVSENVFAQLACHYRSEQLGRIGYEVWRDRYDFEQYRISFSGSYSVTNRIRILLNIHNVLNAPGLRSYLGDPSRPSGHGYDPRRFNVGLRFEI